MKNFLYDLPILPDGFKFPAEYLNVVLADELIDIEPWRFLSKDMATSLFYYSSMLLKFSEAALVPFAIIQDESGLYNDGWVVLACFDGECKEGNACVRIYDYSKPKLSPWDNLSYSGFSDWFISAKEESSRYKAEQVEDNDYS
ncbi:hypothetical protein [Pseudomonas syringae]|uniref:SMI1/KNR4 family protein n=4 Tax=Pseudomonas syringae TaxID=317 RepID=A0A9Q4AA16_PSESX|nr:hypothetical protein [Pseudomonas syringae]MCF5471072.1 hypothetical protein [Pseudomonas syringae]MCF5476013.1 hypothetical protein [Pseudomonas syringae]MCF5486034.1 hypothetical protein [Pseudomonas syringae]MCF5500999.1 hypothetical protein [Pseudomonas syringae]MCF5506258.1 hypothetical protein [Pseudomonas syringae]